MKNLQAAIAARDDAIDRVDRNADERWMRDAKWALWQTIHRTGIGGELTTDDVKCRQPREPRAWGPVMLAAARAGFIENTHRTRKSSEVQNHARPKQVWRVLKVKR